MHPRVGPCRDRWEHRFMYRSQRKQSLPRLVRLLVLSLVAVAFLLRNSLPAAAQSNAVTYNNPLAYIVMDGNFYVTSLDGTGVTAVTSGMIAFAGSEGDFNPPPVHYSGAPHWSPDGTRFAFVDGKSTIYIVESGASPKPLVSNVETGIGNGSLAWTHRGEIAYAVGQGLDIPNGFRIVSLDGIPIRTITLPSGRFSSGGGGGGCGSGGPGPERARLILAEERDRGVFMTALSS